MYVKSTRPSAKREVQKERSAKRDDQIARPININITIKETFNEFCQLNPYLE